MILIVSTPRSGSSLISKVLTDSGYFTENDIKKKDEFNRNGYFEDDSVNKILSSILKKYDLKNEDRRYAPIGLKFDYENYKTFFVNITKHEKYFIKNIKIALCYNVFYYFFSDSKVIILNRPKNKTIKSFNRTIFMNQFENNNQIEKYLNSFRLNKIKIKELFKNSIYIDVDNIVYDKNNERLKLNKFLGTKLDYSSINSEFWT